MWGRVEGCGVLHLQRKLAVIKDLVAAGDKCGEA